MEEAVEVDELTDDAAPRRHAERPRRPLVRSQRVLQVALGLFWILDAALQFQPFMFSKNFVPTFVLANASGQPAVIHWAITNVGNFLAPHPAVWNSLFALTQLAIGVGLLFRRTVRPALALSFPYVLGVWVFGEGLGMLLTGSATALTGAPGSVLLYALIGLMAWPRRTERREATGDGPGSDAPEGIASSAAAQGLGGAITPLVVWTGFWVLSAVLFILPDEPDATSISSAITGMAPGNPHWYSHFLVSTGNHFASTGTADRLGARRPVPRHRHRSIGGTAPRRVPGGRDPPLRALLDHRAGFPRWHPDGVGNGPEHGTADRSPRTGHDAHEAAPRSWSPTPGESFVR